MVSNPLVPEAILLPRGYLAKFGDIFGSHNWRRGVLQALCEKRLGMLLTSYNVWACPPQKTYEASNANSAETENLDLTYPPLM